MIEIIHIDIKKQVICLPNKLIVIHSDGTQEPFKPRFISKTIIKETNIDEELAEKIQRRISNKFYKLQKDGMKEISTAAIRAEVSSQLLQEREFNAEEQSRKLGMSVSEFEDLLNVDSGTYEELDDLEIGDETRIDACRIIRIW